MKAATPRDLAARRKLAARLKGRKRLPEDQREEFGQPVLDERDHARRIDERVSRNTADFDHAQTTGFQYLLIRCDDDGAIHGVELDDFQVRFSTRFAPEIGATVGEIAIGLSSQQVGIVKTWWKEP